MADSDPYSSGGLPRSNHDGNVAALTPRPENQPSTRQSRGLQPKGRKDGCSRLRAQGRGPGQGYRSTGTTAHVILLACVFTLIHGTSGWWAGQLPENDEGQSLSESSLYRSRPSFDDADRCFSKDEVLDVVAREVAEKDTMLAQLRSTCACQCSSAGGENGRGGTARAHRQDTDGDAGEAGAQDTASHTAKNGVHKGEVDLLRNMLTQLQAEYDKQTRTMEATTRELAALRKHVGMPAAADDLQVRHLPDDTLDMYACTIERLPEVPNTVYLRLPFSHFPGRGCIPNAVYLAHAVLVHAGERLARANTC